MKVNEQTAHVCLGNNEVKKGDKVAILINECEREPSSGYRLRPCRKVMLGEGTVTETLNEHYSVVQAEHGLKLEEGMLVERR